MTATEPTERPVGVPPAPPAHPGATTSRRLWIVGAIVVAALAFLVVKGLGNATVFFKTADEAVAQRHSLGTRRFRLEGTVVANSVHQVGNDVAFEVENKAVTVSVVHQGDPPELFRAGIPVVLEGHFASSTSNQFRSDRILVKHNSDYRTKNPTRVKDYSG
jgi:cytochrome c-type biogenesis protein CcmE